MSAIRREDSVASFYSMRDARTPVTISMITILTNLC